VTSTATLPRRRLPLSDLARLSSVGLRTRKLRAGLSALGIAIGVGAIVAVDSSLPRSTGDSHSCFGCHTFRNRMRPPIEISDAPISTIQGLI